MAVTTGKETGSTSSTDKTSSASPGSGGQRGAGSNYGPGSGRPGSTSDTATKASSSQTSAPGKTDKETPAPTSAPGKTDKVGTSEATKKPGLAGIQTQRQQAAFDKQKDLYTQAGGASTSTRQAMAEATKPTQSAKVTDPTRGPNRGLASTSTQTTKTAASKTDNLSRQPVSDLFGKTNLEKPQTVNTAAKVDKQPTPIASRPTNTGFIDSLLSRQPIAPSLAQSVAMDPISYTGPRVGTTPATPASHPNMGIDEAVAQLEERVKRAQQGTLLKDYTPPVPKIADRVPVGLPTGTVADPRVAQMQDQFDRIAAGRGQLSKVNSPTSVQNSPGNAYPGHDGITKDDLGGVFDNGQNAPTEIDIPGAGLPTGPYDVAPSQQGMLPGGNVFHRGVGGLISDVKLASDKARGVGGDVGPSTPSGARSVAPSQEGSYPPDRNFMQDDGQPQNLGELKNRYDYEKGLVKQGIRDLPGRLFDAITKGDVRGLTPGTNDKRPETRPRSKADRSITQQHQVDAVAKLLALIKAMEQQGGSQQQADLVNSTFI